MSGWKGEDRVEVGGQGGVMRTGWIVMTGWRGEVRVEG